MAVPRGEHGFAKTDFGLLQLGARWVLLNFEWKQVCAVILEHFFNQLSVFWRQGFANAVSAALRTVRAADFCEFSPQKRANWVGRCSDTIKIGPRQPELRGRVALAGGTVEKLEPADRVFGVSHANGVNVTEQKFSFGVARIGGWDQVFYRFFKLSIGESIPRGLHIGLCRQGKAAQKKKHSHWVSLWFGICFSGAVGAQDLPKPLLDDAFLQFDPAQARLGQLLFYDPLLSGNRNISCATCHSPEFGSGDGVALSFGEGGVGLGPERRQGSATVRQSRNAPALWNLSAKDVRALFHDGRVERVDGGFRTPAGAQLPDGLNSVLAAQILFPMLARTEMAGDPEENEIGAAAQSNAKEAWRLIAARVVRNAEYREMFDAVYGGVKYDISHIVNALAAYIDVDFRVQNTAFDRYVGGDTTALSAQQIQGLQLFYGDAGCSRCHSGNLFSDQSFHSIGLPQFGPGMTRRFDPVARDVGRMAVSDDLVDAYRFRTPFLRNVARTGPYGHNGAYATLEGIIRHHSDPVAALSVWSPNDVQVLPFDGSGGDFSAFNDVIHQKRLADSIEIPTTVLAETQISTLVAFLKSLNAPAVPAALGRPERVPSGLPLD